MWELLTSLLSFLFKLPGLWQEHQLEAGIKAQITTQEDAEILKGIKRSNDIKNNIDASNPDDLGLLIRPDRRES